LGFGRVKGLEHRLYVLRKSDTTVLHRDENFVSFDRSSTVQKVNILVLNDL